MKTIKKEFLEYKDGAFEITETAERTFSINIESALVHLKEIEQRINKIPLDIEKMQKQKKELTALYNESLQMLVEAKEHYEKEGELKEEFKELELPKVLI